MPRRDVFVMLEDGEWEWVCTTDSDVGEVVVAVQVLYPGLLGVSVEPEIETETNDAM